MKGGIRSGNVCEVEFRIFFLSRLLPKNVKLKTHITETVTTIFCTGLTQCLALRKWRYLVRGQTLDLCGGRNIYDESCMVCVVQHLLLGACSRHGTGKNVYEVLEGKSKGQRLLTWLERLWRCHVKTILTGAGYNIVSWIDVTERRCQRRPLLNPTFNPRVQKKKTREGLDCMNDYQLLYKDPTVWSQIDQTLSCSLSTLPNMT